MPIDEIDQLKMMREVAASSYRKQFGPRNRGDHCPRNCGDDGESEEIGGGMAIDLPGVRAPGEDRGGRCERQRQHRNRRYGDTQTVEKVGGGDCRDEGGGDGHRRRFSRREIAGNALGARSGSV